MFASQEINRFIGTAWGASGYASSSSASGNYAEMGQQSGLFAGGGGYYVSAGNVSLVGGAIASINGGDSELTATGLMRRPETQGVE